MIASVKPPPALKNRNLSKKQLQRHNTAFGHWGEERAKNFLQQQGYQIVDRNLRYKRWEVDIVAYDPSEQILIFVEVKTRTNNFFGSPALAVDRKKMRHLLPVIKQFLLKTRFGGRYRIDCLSVTADGRIEHYKNITW